MTEVLLAARWTATVEDGDSTMAALARALPETGIAARLWRPFEDRLADARMLHLFGTAAEFLPLVDAARQSGVKVVLSPELWHDATKNTSSGRGWAQKAGSWVNKTARGLFTRTPAWQRELFSAVDLVLPNSRMEAQRIARRMKVASARMRVVPHGVDPRLAAADSLPFLRHVGMREFVLYAGAIEPDNQQLGFLWAMKKTDVPLVLVGDVPAKCQWYLEECRRVGGSQAQFVPRRALGGALWASALTACNCLVVGSGVPAGERIALQAGASGTPLVLFDGGCGSEYFGQQAIYVQPDDVADIRRGVMAALERKRSKSLAEHVCTYFSWPAVARALREAYGRARRGTENPMSKRIANERN